MVLDETGVIDIKRSDGADSAKALFQLDNAVNLTVADLQVMGSMSVSLGKADERDGAVHLMEFSNEAFNWTAPGYMVRSTVRLPSNTQRLLPKA